MRYVAIVLRFPIDIYLSMYSCSSSNIDKTLPGTRGIIPEHINNTLKISGRSVFLIALHNTQHRLHTKTKGGNQWAQYIIHKQFDLTQPI